MEDPSLGLERDQIRLVIFDRPRCLHSSHFYPFREDVPVQADGAWVTITEARESGTDGLGAANATIILKSTSLITHTLSSIGLVLLGAQIHDA